jgi:phosphoribosylformylglycinamidine synthase
VGERDDADGSRLVLVGTTKREGPGAAVPRVDLASARPVHEAVAAAIASGRVRACHDLSEGGLGVAVAEMCIAGGLGATLHLPAVPREDGLEDDLAVLFSESAPRYLLEVGWDDLDAVGKELAGVPHAIVATLTAEPLLVMSGFGRGPLLQATLQELTAAYRTGLAL